MPSTIDEAYDLTITNASSQQYMTCDDHRRGGHDPIVLIYQGWTFWVPQADQHLDDPAAAGERPFGRPLRQLGQ